MSHALYASPAKEWAKVQRALGRYIQFRAGNLVYHLYSKGYTEQQVGDILGYSKQRVEQYWPKGEK
jgi:hypothetical protein